MDGSSYNTISNNNTGTGDYFNLMVGDPLPGTATLAAYAHRTTMSSATTSAIPLGRPDTKSAPTLFLRFWAASWS